MTWSRLCLGVIFNYIWTCSVLEQLVGHAFRNESRQAMCVCGQIVHATPYWPPKRHTPLKCRDSHHLPLPTPNIFKTLPECSRNEKYNNPACQRCKHVRSTKFAHATRLLNFTSLELHGGIITPSFSSRKYAPCLQTCSC